jgi:hypothetical protein
MKFLEVSIMAHHTPIGPSPPGLGCGNGRLVRSEGGTSVVMAWMGHPRTDEMRSLHESGARHGRDRLRTASGAQAPASSNASRYPRASGDPLALLFELQLDRLRAREGAFGTD